MYYVFTIYLPLDWDFVYKYANGFEPKPGSWLATVFGGAIQAQLLFEKDPAQGILAWVLCLKSPRIQSLWRIHDV